MNATQVIGSALPQEQPPQTARADALNHKIRKVAVAIFLAVATAACFGFIALPPPLCGALALVGIATIITLIAKSLLTGPLKDQDPLDDFHVINDVETRAEEQVNQDESAQFIDEVNDFHVEDHPIVIEVSSDSEEEEDLGFHHIEKSAEREETNNVSLLDYFTLYAALFIAGEMQPDLTGVNPEWVQILKDAQAEYAKIVPLKEKIETLKTQSKNNVGFGDAPFGEKPVEELKRDYEQQRDAIIQNYKDQLQAIPGDSLVN